MNDRENTLRIIRFDAPERVLTRPAICELAYHGARHEGFDAGAAGDDGPVDARWRDVWGVGWRKLQDGVMGNPEHNPLARPADLAAYRWPNPDDERICGPIYWKFEAFGPEERANTLLAGLHRDTLWEQAYMSVGMEALMAYFYTEPEFVREVLHRIMDFQLGIARHYARLGIKLALLGDDLGTQRGPLLGPRIVEGFLRPEYERLFAFYRQRGVLTRFHSCGNVASVVPMFLDLGVDILNPVQVTANDIDALRCATQGRMALHGGVSSATVMAGPPEKIAAEARQRMWQLGRDGGYFCAPDQGMPYPPEHLAALHAAVEQYGRYPLSPPDGGQDGQE
jgi:uroporphyrinogen decarboxylase